MTEGLKTKVVSYDTSVNYLRYDRMYIIRLLDPILASLGSHLIQ